MFQPRPEADRATPVSLDLIRIAAPSRVVARVGAIDLATLDCLDQRRLVCCCEQLFNVPAVLAAAGVELQ